MEVGDKKGIMYLDGDWYLKCLYVYDDYQFTEPFEFNLESRKVLGVSALDDYLGMHEGGDYYSIVCAKYDTKWGGEL